jgi:hypothetical protein
VSDRHLTDGFVKPQLYKGQSGALNEGRFNVEMSRLVEQLRLMQDRLEELEGCCGTGTTGGGAAPDLPPGQQPDIPPGGGVVPTDEDDWAHLHEHPHTHLWAELSGDAPEDAYAHHHSHPHTHRVTDSRFHYTEFVLMGQIFGD